ncbi:MAG: cyclase [bacterium]|nr:cyclase [bacterium]
MFTDLSVKVTKFARQEVSDNEKMASFGHLGTHFDVMDKEFPLSFVKREGIVFDVSGITERTIEEQDIDISKVQKDMFVAFFSGFIDHVEYGTKKYFKEHPQLSNELIDTLLEKSISIIGIDFAGVRKGEEHTPKDQYCADKGVFIVENLCHLDRVLLGKKEAAFIANTYPINFDGMTGLPCRVVAEL